VNDGDPDGTDDVDGADDVDAAEASSGTELLASGGPSPAAAVCRACSAPRPAEGRFCERCGADLDAASAPVPEHWVAEILADRRLYDRVPSNGLVFPEGRDAVVVALDGAELLIGRRHEGRGIEPAIDLSGPLADPAASHCHVLLARLDDGGYAATDLDSTNGTELNDGRVTLEPGGAHRLVSGDRIHVGAWTTITIRRLP